MGGFRFFRAIFSALISESIWSLTLLACASACSLAQRSAGVSLGGGSRATARGSGVSTARVMKQGGSEEERRTAGQCSPEHFKWTEVMGTAWEQKKLMRGAESESQPAVAPGGRLLAFPGSSWLPYPHRARVGAGASLPAVARCGIPGTGILHRVQTVSYRVPARA